MFDLEIRQKGFDKTIKTFRQYPQIAEQENRKAMNRVTKLVEQVAGHNAPSDIGFLRSKIHGEVRSSGPGSVVGVVGSYARHGMPVEKGASAHWPNIQNLALWVLRKLRVGRGQLQQVTFLVARAISRRGTPAQPYLAPAAEDHQEEINGFFQRALANIVRRLGGG